MDKTFLEDLFSKIGGVRVCVVGDICLDLYWRADMRLSRLSRETPHFPLPVTDERFSPGAGGNVIANLAALGVGKILPVSVIGADWRAHLLKECLLPLAPEEAGLVADPARVTPCYAKPLRRGIADVEYEDPRLDFENRAPLSPAAEAAVLAALDTAARQADIVCVCDQLEYGAVSPAVRKRLCEIGREMPVLADSRDRIGLYENVIVKPNDIEAAAAADGAAPEEAAKILSARTRAPALVTCGAGGAIWCENGACVRVPAVKTEPPVDPVGAGDTFLAAFAAAYACLVSGPEAATFANLAAAVTVKKIGETGTATKDEILKLADF